MNDASRVYLSAITLTALLAGCNYSSARPVSGPDGQPGWFSVWCKVDRGKCAKKADEVCPYGYELNDLNENTNTTFAAYKSAYVTPSYRAYMIIKCYGPASAAAVVDGGADGG